MSTGKKATAGETVPIEFLERWLGKKLRHAVEKIDAMKTPWKDEDTYAKWAEARNAVAECASRVEELKRLAKWLR